MALAQRSNFATSCTARVLPARRVSTQTMNSIDVLLGCHSVRSTLRLDCYTQAVSPPTLIQFPTVGGGIGQLSHAALLGVIHRVFTPDFQRQWMPPMLRRWARADRELWNHQFDS